MRALKLPGVLDTRLRGHDEDEEATCKHRNRNTLLQTRGRRSEPVAAPIGPVQICPGAGRRRAGAGASAVGVVGPRADAGGGHRALQPGARSDRPGAAALRLRRRDRGQGARRGRARLPARRARLPQRAAGRAAERRFRRHHGAPAALCRVHAPLSAGAAEAPAMRGSPRSRPRRSRRWPITCAMPPNG